MPTGARQVDERVGSLDTLRGIAILMVIAFHVSLAFPAGSGLLHIPQIGFLGVQLFFLVSSVTMCFMWERRSGPNPTWSFYIRRFFRIAPLFWGGIVFYGLLRSELLGIGFPGTNDPVQILLTALFLHPFVPAAINSVVPGGWSIGIEMNFYALFPLLVRLQPHRLLPVALLSYVLMGLVATNLLEGQGGLEQESTFLYYSLLTQFPIFLIGMFIYWIAMKRTVRWTITASVTVCAWLVLALAGKVLFNLTARPVFWLEIAVMGAMTALVITRGMAFAPLSYIGRISYSMYIFHFAVLFFLERMIGNSNLFIVGLILTLILTIPVSILSQKTAETWSQRLGRAVASRVSRQ